MEQKSLIVNTARHTLELEAKALGALAETIGDGFAECVATIHASGGRIVVTGIGKTALVARKIVATLNSTGSPAIFLHAADAIHGDIGMVQAQDVVLCISKSGETAEIKLLARIVRRMGNTIVAMTARRGSSLAIVADHVLITPIEREADPNNLAPTTSTTLQMAMGDALATALLSLKEFSPTDFARFHPGGTLGKQLYLTVSDLFPHNNLPAVRPSATARECVIEITAGRLGATAVIDPENEELVGIITDGDLRRALNAHPDIAHLSAADLMTPAPVTIAAGTLAVDALELMQRSSITQLPVVGENGKYVGVVHLHDLIREGLA